METVLRDMSTGVVSLDTRGFFTTINKSAEKMLEVKAEQLLRRNYKKVLKTEHLKMAEDFLKDLQRSPKNSLERPLRITINQTARTFMIYMTALKDDAGYCCNRRKPAFRRARGAKTSPALPQNPRRRIDDSKPRGFAAGRPRYPQSRWRGSRRRPIGLRGTG